MRTPTSNVDVAPTLLHVMGLRAEAAAMDGRPLHEALASGPDTEQVTLQTSALHVQAGGYRAVLQISTVGDKRYVDKAWREQ